MRNRYLFIVGALCGATFLSLYLLHGKKNTRVQPVGLVAPKSQSSDDRQPANSYSPSFPRPRDNQPHRDSLEAEARSAQELEREKEIFSRYPELQVNWVRAKRRQRILQSRARNANRQPPPNLDVEVWLRDSQEQARKNDQRVYTHPRDLPPGAFPYPDR